MNVNYARGSFQDSYKANDSSGIFMFFLTFFLFVYELW